MLGLDPLRVNPIDAFDGLGIEASRVWRVNTSNEPFQTRTLGRFCGLGVVDDTRLTGAPERQLSVPNGDEDIVMILHLLTEESHRPRGCVPFLLFGHCNR